MTLSAIRLPRWRVLDGPSSEGLPSWSSAIEAPSPAEIEAARHLGMTRRWLAQMPEGWSERIQRAIASVWYGRAESELVLEVLVTDGAGSATAIRCTDPTVRVGSGEGCHVALPGDLPSEAVEIRFEDEAWVLVDLGTGVATTVGGEPLPQHGRREIEAGDALEVGGSVLEITFAGRSEVGPHVAVLTREILAAGEVDGLIDAPGAEWVDLRIGERQCFLRVDSSWTRFAYGSLGYPLPDDAVDYGNEVDRGLSLFVFEKMVDEIRRDGVTDIECRGYASASRVRHDGQGRARDWAAAVFDVRVDDEALQVQVLWPAETLSERPLPLAWLRTLEHAISVFGGTTRLTPEDLRELEQGDVILPDRWTLQRGPDGIAIGGSVLLRIQDWNREADLRVTRRGQAIVLRDETWIRSAKGVLMPSDQVEPIETEADEREPRPIEEEIELTLAFELDRIAVPMRELSEWQEGSTVVLKRSPDDSVRVLLQHGGGSRVVGSGRVVQVEGQLGIRLEEWWPQQQEEDPSE